ncbi:MAG: EF-hand domain-containing protein [Planctomycetes bacterium]|nr:EF-hand domain-containing protein [Planctomycetota bacterium]
MRKVATILSVVAAMLVVLGSASAGDDEAGAKGKGKGKGKLGNPEQIFKKLDTNNDGKLSKDEFMKMADRVKDAEKAAKFKSVLERAWTKLSVNDAITLDQFKKFQEMKGKKKKAAADTE